VRKKLLISLSCLDLRRPTSDGWSHYELFFFIHYCCQLHAVAFLDSRSSICDVVQSCLPISVQFRMKFLDLKYIIFSKQLCVIWSYISPAGEKRHKWEYDAMEYHSLMVQ